MTGRTRIQGAALLLTALRGYPALGAFFAVGGESPIPRTAKAIGLPSSEFTCSQPRGQVLLKHVMAHCAASMSNTAPRLVRPMKSIVISLLLFLLAVAPANAGMWMMVYAEGQKPDRTVYYAAFDDVQSRTSPEAFLEALQRTGDPIKAEAATKVNQIRVNQIHEAAGGPWLTMFTLEFQCGSQQMRITQQEQHYRQNGRSQQVPGLDWSAITAPWQAQARLLACDEARWKKALEADRRRGQGQDELNKLGLVVVGDHVLPMELNDLSFATLWRDGTEPAFTTNKSPAELDRLRRETIARGEALSTEMRGKEQNLRRDIESSQAEDAFMAQVDRNFAAKKYPKQFKDLVHSMKGLTEPEIIEVMGYPDGERLVGGDRLWVYYSEKDERVANVVSKYGHVAVTGELRECELTFILREGGKKSGGRLFDYQMAGDNCNLSTMKRSSR